VSLSGFEGCAGTGKTTQLRQAARDHLEAHPLGEAECVLALTKMHGSRKRMLAALTGPDGLNAKVACLTIDSFARTLVRRWRSLLRLRGTELPEEEDWPAVTSAAAELLTNSRVTSWVAQRYPVVVVDEMQDCRGGELGVLQCLAGVSAVLCAADGFQDLFGEEGNEAVEWSRSMGAMTTLEENHRTQESYLLEAAAALRAGQDLPLGKDWSPYQVLSAPKPAIGAARVAWMLKHSWSKLGETVAVLSTARSENSPFVRALLDRLGEKEFVSRKGDKRAGPYRIRWETGEQEEVARLLHRLDLPANESWPVTTRQLAASAAAAAIGDLREWADRRVRLGYDEELAEEQISRLITTLVRRRRAFGVVRQRRRSAMTIHQAKNREFDNVVVLWPMQVKGSPLRKRRLLYNAITRAKRSVLVVVQDPKGKRLEEAPFRAG